MFNLNKNKGFIRRDMASAIQETISQTFFRLFSVFYIIQLLTAQLERSSSTKNNLHLSFCSKINKKQANHENDTASFTYLLFLIFHERPGLSLRLNNQATLKRDRLRSNWLR